MNRLFWISIMGLSATLIAAVQIKSEPLVLCDYEVPPVCSESSGCYPELVCSPLSSAIASGQKN
ncbi:hypothetical protein [Laspinema olomoucense]|uniref:Uncharacterized protein n=1 Tax=Laspinema olomoucense D3b TaxID=2953688 RepID=A0ABT2N0L8_9CYAN|nr:MULTISPECIES: hypothetical protein [unclassified Laspinema]MCT7970959.1 hypothetical protein [Laspinema sp. D3d]MCT7976223.1 hypothetical protein [Laspinema sp. D3b]MCT7989971.1 hypothetical protein [Laspinema sp. D3a]MCT7995726.1 hypothetical protein [Laspinema sp. D3c]